MYYKTEEFTMQTTSSLNILDLNSLRVQGIFYEHQSAYSKHFLTSDILYWLPFFGLLFNHEF